MKLCGQLAEVGSPEDPFVLRATAGRRRKGHSKVAHYEVVGRVFTKAIRHARDD